MRTYNSFEEIDQDLKRISLERDIAWEELKLSKNRITEQFSYPNWMSTIAKGIGKYGFYLLIKKFIK
jgi:hypothetical protein